MFLAELGELSKRRRRDALDKARRFVRKEKYTFPFYREMLFQYEFMKMYQRANVSYVNKDKNTGVEDLQVIIRKMY